MNRRKFIFVLGGAAVPVWPVSLRGQEAVRKPRIGYLSGAQDSAGEASAFAFRQAIENLGWIDGHNVHIDVRWAGADRTRAAAVVAEMVASAPDIIVSIGTLVTGVAKEQTNKIPIVFVNVADPVDSGFVSTWAKPDSNATGFAAWELTIGGKWLEVLKEIAPNVAHVLVLLNPENPTWIGHMSTIESLAKSVGVEVRPGRLQQASELEGTITSFASLPAGGIVVLPSGFTQIHRASIIHLAEQHRLPAVYPYRFHVASGGLVSYGTDPVELHRRAASYVDKILKGAKPTDLPVQAPTKFEMVINLKTAKALGLTVPATLLARADEVIE